MKESIVLLVLGACWAGYLSWYWRENRRTSYSRSDGISAFSSGLGSLGGSASRSMSVVTSVSVMSPRTAGDAARRRREVLIGLCVAAVLSLVVAVGVGGIAVLLHVMIDLALLSYSYALVQRRNDAAEREIKVHMLHPERTREIDLREKQLVNG